MELGTGTDCSQPGEQMTQFLSWYESKSRDSFCRNTKGHKGKILKCSFFYVNLTLPNVSVGVDGPSQ